MREVLEMAKVKSVQNGGSLSCKVRAMILSMRDDLGYTLPTMGKLSGVPDTKISTFVNGGPLHLDSLDKLYKIIPPSVLVKWYIRELYESMNPSTESVPQELLTI